MKVFFYGITIAAISCFWDQLTKKLVVEYFMDVGFISAKFTTFFNLVYVQNYGVSFGMFNNLKNGQIILSLVAFIITLGLTKWLLNVKCFFTATALGLIIGGAYGNIYDRVMLGYVVDFLDFHIYSFHWPAFNVADSCIFIGVVMLIFEPIFMKNTNEEK